jgi:hypothetical protein
MKTDKDLLEEDVREKEILKRDLESEIVVPIHAVSIEDSNSRMEDSYRGFSPEKNQNSEGVALSPTGGEERVCSNHGRDTKGASCHTCQSHE